MLVVTTNDIPGWEIRSRNAFAQIGAGFKSMFGGELQGMTKNLADRRSIRSMTIRTHRPLSGSTRLSGAGLSSDLRRTPTSSQTPDLSGIPKLFTGLLALRFARIDWGVRTGKALASPCEVDVTYARLHLILIGARPHGFVGNPHANEDGDQLLRLS